MTLHIRHALETRSLSFSACKRGTSTLPKVVQSAGDNACGCETRSPARRVGKERDAVGVLQRPGLEGSTTEVKFKLRALRAWKGARRREWHLLRGARPQEPKLFFPSQLLSFPFSPSGSLHLPPPPSPSLRPSSSLHFSSLLSSPSSFPRFPGVSSKTRSGTPARDGPCACAGAVPAQPLVGSSSSEPGERPKRLLGPAVRQAVGSGPVGPAV